MPSHLMLPRLVPEPEAWSLESVRIPGDWRLIDYYTGALVQKPELSFNRHLSLATWSWRDWCRKCSQAL
jgi:hypothetical protein